MHSRAVREGALHAADLSAGADMHSIAVRIYQVLALLDLWKQAGVVWHLSIEAVKFIRFRSSPVRLFKVIKFTGE